MRYPTDNNRITSKYGYRYRTKEGKKVLDFHGGIDYGGRNAGVPGDPLYPIVDNSRVAFVDFDQYRGNNIILEHDTHCTRYNHFEEIHVFQGDVVNEKDILGLMGNSGDSTAAHCHFEVHECKYENFHERWSNGEYKHTIDPELFFLKYLKPKHQLIRDIENILESYK